MVIEPTAPTASNDSHGGFQPLFSQFHEDPDMSEILDEFLNEVLARARELVAMVDQGDRRTLGRILHKIKGAAGGYGYPSITEAAERLEMHLETAQRGCEQECVKQVHAINHLIERAYVTRLHHLPGRVP